MSPTREQISQALLAQLQSATFAQPMGTNNLTTWANQDPSARRLVLFDDPSLGSADQPALYLVAHDEEYVQQGRGVPRRTGMMFSAVCYCRAEKGEVGDIYLNLMFEAIDTALAPQQGPDMVEGVSTLGGLVNRCWIRGRIFRDPGDLDNQAMLIVPIEVIVP